MAVHVLGHCRLASRLELVVNDGVNVAQRTRLEQISATAAMMCKRLQWLSTRSRISVPSKRVPDIDGRVKRCIFEVNRTARGVSQRRQRLGHRLR